MELERKNRLTEGQDRRTEEKGKWIDVSKRMLD
jgi:hypothetical protein